MYRVTGDVKYLSEQDKYVEAEVTILDERDPWERMQGEHAEAYEAFLHYRDLGSYKRSLKRVSDWRRDLKGLEGESTFINGVVGQWSTKYNWMQRCEAWDRYQADLQDHQWQERQVALRQKQWEASEKLFDIGFESIDKLDKDKLTPSNIIEIIRLASTLGGQTKEEPLDREVVKDFMRRLPATLRIKVIQQLREGG